MNLIGGTNDCVGADNPTHQFDKSKPRKLDGYASAESFRCPSDDYKGLYPESWKEAPSYYEYWGSSYLYNDSWSLYGSMPWALHGRRTFDVTHPLTYMFADASIWYAFPYYPYGDGPHGNEFFWHDPPEDHPGARPLVDWRFWTLLYGPKCNIAFVDGSVQLTELVTYEVGDMSTSGPGYVLEVP